MPQSSFLLKLYRAFRGGPLGARYPYCMHTSVVPLRELYLLAVDSTVRGNWVRAHLIILPGWKHYSYGILTPSEMSCLNAGCRCKDLVEFLPRPRSVLSFPGFQLLSRSFLRQFLSRGRSYTHHTFSRKRMDLFFILHRCYIWSSPRAKLNVHFCV